MSRVGAGRWAVHARWETRQAQYFRYSSKAAARRFMVACAGLAPMRLVRWSRRRARSAKLAVPAVAVAARRAGKTTAIVEHTEALADGKPGHPGPFTMASPKYAALIDRAKAVSHRDDDEARRIRAEVSAAILPIYMFEKFGEGADE